MLYRHEINYWFSDALMGLNVVFQLLLNVHLQLPYSSIYFKNRQVTLGTFTDLHLLVACLLLFLCVCKKPRQWHLI